MRLGFAAVFAVTATVLPSVASAAGGRFGGRGQLVISDDQSLGQVGIAGTVSPSVPGSTHTASFQFATLSDNGGSGTEFGVAPAVDYFVIDGLTLGAGLIFAVINPAHGNDPQGETITVFGIAPRVGYNIPITDTISFWPKVFFAYESTSVSNNLPGGFNSTALGVFAPFMFHLAPHFFLGIGPNLLTQLSNNETQGNASASFPKVTQLGIDATLGGWLLGD